MTVWDCYLNSETSNSVWSIGSLDGEVVILNLDAELGLQITELLLETTESGEDDILRFQGTT